MYYLLQPAMGLPAQALERTKLYRRTAHLRRTHRAHGTHSLTAEKEPQEVAKYSPLRSKTCIQFAIHAPPTNNVVHQLSRSLGHWRAGM